MVINKLVKAPFIIPGGDLAYVSTESEPTSACIYTTSVVVTEIFNVVVGHETPNTEFIESSSSGED